MGHNQREEESSDGETQFCVRPEVAVLNLGEHDACSAHLQEIQSKRTRKNKGQAKAVDGSLNDQVSCNEDYKRSQET